MRWLFLCFLLLSCSQDDMKKYSKLEGLRILAVAADTPEINAASTVTLTPFLSYTDGGNTTLNLSWQACIDPGIAYGASISCEGQPLIDSGNYTFNTSTLSATYYTGNMTAFGVDVPATVFTYLASLEAQRQFNGIDILVIINVEDSTSSQSIEFIKRIKLTSKSSGLNQNPTIIGKILASGQELTQFPPQKVSMTLSGISAAESYLYQSSTSTVTLTESMYISWFSSEGEFQFSRTDTKESVSFDPQAKTVGILVGVVRDGRGGVAIIYQSF